MPQKRIFCIGSHSSSSPLIPFSFSFLVSPIFQTCILQNPPSERAILNSVRFIYTVSTLLVALRGLAEGSFAEPHPWIHVYIFQTMRFYGSSFLFCINLSVDRFSIIGYTIMSALDFLSSSRRLFCRRIKF